MNTERITKRKYRSPEGSKCAFCSKPEIHKIGRLLTCSDSVCKMSVIERLKPGEL